jgi:2-polyprenyl-3-methyl-5-hydroxy-6-metoxy-1,4-benzoquinol methylase
MDDLSKEYVISIFDKNLQLHGDRPEAVGWSAEGERLHYQSLLDIGKIDHAKILDFGCGKGDFFQFLSESGIVVDYTGYDINEKLISLAQKKYGGNRFRVFDMDEDIIAEDFDYIFLCGVFNLRIAGLDVIIKNTLTRLFQHCRQGLAFNALSALNPKKDFQLHYTSPDELFNFAVKTLSPYVALRHDRILYDFTLFIYNNPQQGE